MKKLTNKERNEYRAKKEANKARLAEENKWFDYRQSIYCSEDYCPLESSSEYVVYYMLGIDNKYHIDLRNGMKFTCTAYKEIQTIIENFA